MPSAISCSQLRSADSFDWHIRVWTSCIWIEESHLLLRLIYSLIKVGFLFLLISFGTERWEPVCEARGGKHHVVLCVSLLLSVGSVKSTDRSQQGECAEPCAGGRPTQPVGGWKHVGLPGPALWWQWLCWELVCPCSPMLCKDVVCPSAANDWSTRSSLSLWNRTQSCRALKATRGVFLGLGLRAVQGINLSKWERQRFALCEVCCDTEQDGVRSFPFSTGVCLRNPQPSLARLKAALMNLIEDWSDCLHFASWLFWWRFNELFTVKRSYVNNSIPCYIHY